MTEKTNKGECFSYSDWIFCLHVCSLSVEFCQFKIFFCCCSLQICNKCNPKTTHFSYHKTANGILWQFFVWLHFVTTSIADVLNAVACCAPFDIYTRCLFALEHVKREFDLIKGKLQTMLKVIQLNFIMPYLF